MTTVYTALVTRGKATWLASVKGLPNDKTVLSMGKSWKQLKTLTEEACDHALGVPDGDTVVSLEFEDPELQILINELEKRKVALRAAKVEMDAALGRAARRLTQEATLRDVAEMLGYSHQYISTLASPRTG